MYSEILKAEVRKILRRIILRKYIVKFFFGRERKKERERERQYITQQ